jgi:tetratricopeptide (TPR) repeat protein
MRCKCLQSLALAIAILGVLAARLAAEDAHRSDVKSSSTQTVIRDSEAASSTKSDVAAPTPAKHKSDAGIAYAESPSKTESIKQPGSKTEPAAEESKEKAADEAMQPVPDPLEAASVTIEAASFNGVTPGVTSKDGVESAWGKPKNMAEQNGSPVQLYAVEPFNRVEVSYVGDKVSSVVIRFDRPFPADAVAKQLELSLIRPVSVVSAAGETLGLAYPERGVLFAFQPSDEPDKPSMKVMQIVLEPITAEAFVLRAETTLDDRKDLSLRDLEQALELEPKNARAHWLHSRLLTVTEQHEKATAAAAEAVRNDPDNAQYRVTHALALAQVGRSADAVEEARKAADIAQKQPLIKARALCVIGDLMASNSKPDYKMALSYHTQSIQLADPLTTDKHRTIRVAAKEVLVDAHLGAAHDIAWGEWKEKDKAVARWLQRAVTVSEDLLKNEGASQEVALRVHSRALAACVGLRGTIDPGPAAKAVITSGDELIVATKDASQKARLQSEIGTALYDAVQIWQMRSDQQSALKYGELAAQYLTKAREADGSPSSTFLLGRLYFRMGAIHAIQDHDHKAAIACFGKAIPLLEDLAPEDIATDMGRHGESFISMGVSYWEVGQKQKAVDLTQRGVKWMEQAVTDGSLDKSALAIPYNNLAAMHRQLGSGDLADRLQEMASRAKKENLK